MTAADERVANTDERIEGTYVLVPRGCAVWVFPVDGRTPEPLDIDPDM